jgi:hypothetical protein
MLSKKTIVLVGLLILSVRSFGQKSEKQIGLGFGPAYYAVRNNSVSTFSHTGVGLPIACFFRSNTEKNRHHVQIFYAAPNLESASKLVLAQMEIGYLQYAYHRGFAFAKENIRFFGGVVLNYSSIHRVTTWDNGFNDVTGEKIMSINPSFLAEISLNENAISIQAWSSLLAHAVTNGYTKWDRETNWLSIADFASIDVRVAYSRELSEKWGVRFDYKFEFSHLQKYQSVVLLSQQTLLSVFYRIR